MNPNKEIDITSLSVLGDNIDQIKKTLTEFSKAKVKVFYNGMLVDVSILSMFCDYIIEMDRQKRKKKQKEGIEKALKRKSEGIGKYGRPKIVLPNDFEKQICEHLKNKIPLSEYQEKIKMKKSTFYRYAKISQEKQ